MAAKSLGAGSQGAPQQCVVMSAHWSDESQARSSLHPTAAVTAAAIANRPGKVETKILMEATGTRANTEITEEKPQRTQRKFLCDLLASSL